MTDPGFGLTVYDNLYKGYSPEGKNTLNIISLQGYDCWKSFGSTSTTSLQVNFMRCRWIRPILTLFTAAPRIMQLSSAAATAFWKKDMLTSFTSLWDKLKFLYSLVFYLCLVLKNIFDIKINFTYIII